jgi:hypothetical protein
MKIKSIFLAFFLLFSFQVYAGDVKIPSGYNVVKSAKGVALFRNRGGSVYVQVVDLSLGAKVTFGGLADIADSRDHKYYRESIRSHWNNYSRDSDLFAVTNG